MTAKAMDSLCPRTRTKQSGPSRIDVMRWTSLLHPLSTSNPSGHPPDTPAENQMAQLPLVLYQELMAHADF